MSDLAFELLSQAIDDSQQPGLWLLDENIPAQLPKPRHGLTVLTNRIDVQQRLAAAGFSCHFGDFSEFQSLWQDARQVFYRISKEKALGHYLINQAAEQLAPAGQLIISGAKQQGIKGFIDRAAERLGEEQQRWKADKQHWAACLVRSETPGQVLDDKDYPTLRASCADQHFDYISKPGVFGWDKIDAGSELLVQHLEALCQDHSINSVLDIGCGYGYLSLNCHRLFNCQVIATDNNASAVAACGANFASQQVQGQALASNCAQGVEGKFDLVIVNPPFHTGFAVDGGLTERFIEAAAKRLAPGGIALFVVNLHIGLEQRAKGYFSRVETALSGDHFKLVKLSN